MNGEVLEHRLRGEARIRLIESFQFAADPEHYAAVWQQVMLTLDSHGVDESYLIYDFEDEVFDQFAGTLRVALLRHRDRHTAVAP